VNRKKKVVNPLGRERKEMAVQLRKGGQSNGKVFWRLATKKSILCKPCHEQYFYFLWGPKGVWDGKMGGSRQVCGRGGWEHRSA